MPIDSFSRMLASRAMQSALPDSFTVNLPRDASTILGTGTSGVAALQALANNPIPEVRLNAFYNFADTSTGSTLLDGAVLIPTGESWRGQGMRAKFVIAATDPRPAGYIMLGADASAQSSQNYDLQPNKSFGGIYLDGRAAATNGKSPVGIVVGGPTWRIHDIYAFQMQTVVRAGEVTGAFGQLNVHADHLRISNVHLNAQPNPADFDPANASAARYGIDFLRTQAGADGAEIERCQSNVTNELGLTAKRCRFIGLRAFTNAKVRSTINGDIFFYQSTGTVEECYFEHGVVSNMQSEMLVRGCHFFMRNELTVGSDVGAVPVQFLATPAGVASAAAVPSSLSLRDCAFNYDASGSGSVPGTVIALGGYTLTNPNFSIGAGIYGTMTVENCWRAAPYSNGRGWYPRLGVTCGMADFDNYSHFASVSSRYTGSGSGGDRWHIEAKRGAVTTTSATTVNGIESATFDTGFKGPFRAASATYYYRAAILHDKIRAVGILGGLEVTQAAVNGVSGAISLRLGLDLPGGGFIARIYRGTTPGSYDRYVDVPVLEAGRLYDSGVDIGGYPWLARTAGAPDVVNAGLSGGIELSPGERTSASDAYGRIVVFALANTMPSTGGWRRGDEIRFATPLVNGSMRQTGWRRLTNCTSAAPAHTLDTDWQAISTQAAPANGQTIGVSTAAMTLNAGERLATVGPGSVTQTITVAAANEAAGYSFFVNVKAQNIASFAVNINKASGSTSVTLRSPGMYLVVWRDDLAIWHATRIGNMALNGTIDEGANGFEQFVGGTGAINFNQNAQMINVSSAGGAVAITMPATIEQGGITRRLLVRSFTNAITVAKSTGTVSSSGVITQVGLYELVYTLGTWLVTRLGGVPA